MIRLNNHNARHCNCWVINGYLQCSCEYLQCDGENDCIKHDIQIRINNGSTQHEHERFWTAHPHAPQTFIGKPTRDFRNEARPTTDSCAVILVVVDVTFTCDLSYAFRVNKLSWILIPTCPRNDEISNSIADVEDEFCDIVVLKCIKSVSQNSSRDFSVWHKLHSWMMTYFYIHEIYGISVWGS